jgi:hypothetical protein
MLLVVPALELGVVDELGLDVDADEVDEAIARRERPRVRAREDLAEAELLDPLACAGQTQGERLEPRLARSPS